MFVSQTISATEQKMRKNEIKRNAKHEWLNKFAKWIVVRTFRYIHFAMWAAINFKLSSISFADLWLLFVILAAFFHNQRRSSTSNLMRPKPQFGFSPRSRCQRKQNHAFSRMNYKHASLFFRWCSHWRCWIRSLSNTHLRISISIVGSNGR